MKPRFAPQWLYDAHGSIVERMFDGRGMRWIDRVALAVVRWTMDRFEMWVMRYGPTQGCPDCYHYDSICDLCRAGRKERWG